MFIQELEIFKAFRKKGYGKNALMALGYFSFFYPAEVAALFVQPEHTPAFNLYKKLEFQPGKYEFVPTNWNLIEKKWFSGVLL